MDALRQAVPSHDNDQVTLRGHGHDGHVRDPGGWRLVRSRRRPGRAQSDRWCPVAKASHRLQGAGQLVGRPRRRRRGRGTAGTRSASAAKPRTTMRFRMERPAAATTGSRLDSRACASSTMSGSAAERRAQSISFPIARSATRPTRSGSSSSRWRSAAATSPSSLNATPSVARRSSRRPGTHRRRLAVLSARGPALSDGSTPEAPRAAAPATRPEGRPRRRSGALDR